MANYAIFGGAGYFTAATLGNLLTADKIRIFAKKVRIPIAGGFLFSQSGAGTSREFGLLFNSGELRYIYGSSTERLLLTTAELNTIAGTSAPWALDSIDFRTDSTALTAELYINGVLRKSLTLQKGASRIDGMLFRLGARSNADSTDTSGGFITPSGTWIGDTDVYINDVLVRRYTMPSTGNTVPESVSGSILTQRGTWPGDDSEWGSYVDPQGFTVTQSTVKPGDTISGSYAGWPSAPTASLVLTDTAANTLTLTPTVVGGAGSGTWSATVPALPATGSDVELLKFGATTISFGGFTAKAGPTLQVAATQTLATLASGFDDYVFQGWLPQPAVGDQLVTVTADGIFNSNGDYTFYAEGVYSVWYVDGTGQVYGRTIDTSGLNEPEPTEQGILADILQPILTDVLRYV